VLSKARQLFENGPGRTLRDWYYTFMPSQSTIFSPDRCCLSIDQGKIFLVHVRKTDKLAELALSQTLNYRHIKEIKPILAEVVEKHALDGIRCSLILRPEQYQLLQTEALPVAPSEFQSAIRWKVKDLIRFPVDDAVIDSFSLPAAKLPTSLNTIMLVIARASILKPLCDQISASGLKLTTIDIPELSFRNLTALYEKDEKSTALIYMQEEKSQLIVTNQQKFYFSRHFGFGIQQLQAALANKEENKGLEELVNEAALDIQRSFDYYQSQWRLSEPARVFLETLTPISLDLTELLSQRLNIKVNKIDLNEYFTNKAQVDLKRDGYFLPLLGGVLRDWEPNYATGN